MENIKILMLGWPPVSAQAMDCVVRPLDIRFLLSVEDTDDVKQ